MNDPSRACIRCGSEDLEAGEVVSTGRLYFRPRGVRFLSFRTANVRVRASACPCCGTVDVVGDVEKLGKLTTPASAEKK